MSNPKEGQRMSPLCIYHGGCDDGFAAAWCVNAGIQFSRVQVMKIEFVYREPGNHHVIRTEDGQQPVPRAGDTVHIGESGYTVREVLWIRDEKTARIYLD